MHNGNSRNGAHGAPSAGIFTPEAETAAPTELGANYRYWREHGGEWADEYNRRKKVEPLYHMQEIMLTDYIARCAPAKVLEFGCGVGRHLCNLSKLPGIDVHGYDQSRAMVSGCLRWTTQKWLDEHVTVGNPTGPLPYADGEFDVVYTAEVLLHSRPEDIETILRELIRVCRGHILHLETAESYALIQDDHDGCWKHDLPAAYAKLGHTLEVFDLGYSAHRPYRLKINTPGPQPAWPATVLAVMRRAESDLCEGISSLRTQALEATQRAEQFEASAAALPVADRRIRELEADRDRLYAEAKDQQAWIAKVESERDQSIRVLEANIKQLEADRDRLYAEAKDQQAWIAKVESERDHSIKVLETSIRQLESDRDRLFAEAKEKQAWVTTVEADRDRALATLNTTRTVLAEAQEKLRTAVRQEGLLCAQIAGLTTRLQDQSNRAAAAEHALSSFAEAIKQRARQK